MSHSTLLVTLLALALPGCLMSPEEEPVPTHLHTLWDYAYDLDGGAPRALPFIVGDKVITSGDLSVTALNYHTGELLWKTPFEATDQIRSAYFGLYDNVLVGSIHKPVSQIPNGHALIGIDVHSGEKLWEEFFDRADNEILELAGLTVIPGGFLQAGYGSWVFTLTPSGERTKHATDAFFYNSIAVGDILYVAHRYQGTGAFSAYRLPELELLWRYHPGDLAHLTRMQPIVENGRVYMVSGSQSPRPGTVQAAFALDAATGQELWRTNGVRSIDLADHTREYIYVNPNGALAKIRKSDGHVVYNKDFNAGAGAGPVAYLDGYAYVMTPGSMHIVRAEDGQIMARMSPPKGSFFWRVTAHDGRIFAQSSRHLYAFAPWGHTQPITNTRPTTRSASR